jgi:hypothetical protein
MESVCPTDLIMSQIWGNKRVEQNVVPHVSELLKEKGRTASHLFTGLKVKRVTVGGKKVLAK